MDRLSEILRHMSISAQVFRSGSICGVFGFAESQSHHGYIHLVNRGRLTLQRPNKKVITIEEPSLVFYPRPTAHRLMTSATEEVEIVCATIEIGAGPNNPIASALPESIVVPLSTSDNLAKVTRWLFEEAFLNLEARQVMLDRLAEIIVIQLLRFVMEEQKSLTGLLNGLIHPQLGKLIQEIHRAPENDWNLENMAQLALMSRSKFAQTFKDTLGQTPADYLLAWRVSLAQTYLRSRP